MSLPPGFSMVDLSSMWGTGSTRLGTNGHIYNIDTWYVYILIQYMYDT